MWLGLGLGLGLMMPLKTWPVARRQQSGMMGLLVERSSSNCTTVAAYARAFGSARRASSVRIGCRVRVRVRSGLGLGLGLRLALTFNPSPNPQPKPNLQRDGREEGLLHHLRLGLG